MTYNIKCVWSCTGSPEEEQKAIEESKKIAEELEIKEALEKSAKHSAGSSSSSAAAPSTSGSSSNRVLPTDKFTENDVADLMKNGFQRAQCIEELRKFGGDKKNALASLFAKSLKF